MTVGQLRKRLETIPDDRPIKVCLNDGPGWCELEIDDIDPRAPATLLQTQHVNSEDPVNFRWRGLWAIIRGGAVWTS